MCISSVKGANKHLIKKSKMILFRAGTPEYCGPCQACGNLLKKFKISSILSVCKKEPTVP